MEAVLPGLVADAAAAEEVDVVVAVQVCLDRYRPVKSEFDEEIVEDGPVSSVRVRVGPGQERRERRERRQQHCAAHTPLPVSSQVAGYLPSLIAGHRNPLAADDDAHRQIEESRRYLADFETALERSSTPPDLIDRMTATYPDLANPYTLWVAAYDLLGSRT